MSPGYVQCERLTVLTVRMTGAATTPADLTTTRDAIDPSGGPYISVGMDMEYIHEDLKGLVIESIERTKEGEDKLFLKTKLL